jgi:arylsulfatase A-like enzyme
MSHYEPSVRVPLIITGPGVQKNIEVNTPVSLVDIYPTLMEMAELQHPSGLDGNSLMPELTDNPSNHPDWALSEFHGTTCNTGAFMLRRGAWKYIAYVGYEPQLFNLKNDPDEVRNLANSRPDVVKEMDDLLRQIVAYESMDAKVKEYDKRSFRQWREEQLAAGTYEDTMARVYSGWDNLSDDDIMPWTEEDESLIQQWLDSD